MIEKIRKPELEHGNAPAPGSVEEYNANHLSASAGHPLHMPEDLRARLEERMGVDLGNIQLRESGQPESIGARAFARGNVIDFAPGEFRPGTQEGDAVIGHEVSHVLQQASGQVRADSGASPVNADPALEHAADEGVQGGMESVPTMSYSASPVQGLFGLNHFRQWRKNRAAKKAAAKAAAAPAPIASENHSLSPMDFRTTGAGPLAPAGAGGANAAALASVFENADEEVDLNKPLTPPAFPAPQAPAEEAQSAPAPSEEIDLNTPLTPPAFPAPKSPSEQMDLYMPMKPPSFAAPKSPAELEVMQTVGPMKPKAPDYTMADFYANMAKMHGRNVAHLDWLKYMMDVHRVNIMNTGLYADPRIWLLNRGVEMKRPQPREDLLEWIEEQEQE